MLAMKYFVVLLALISSWTQGAPTALKSPGEVRDAMLGGCLVRAMVHMDKCRVNFPDDLPRYSFAYDLHDAFLSLKDTPGHVTLSCHRMVNGSRLGLKHLAKRLVTGSMDGQGVVEMTMADVNPTSGKVLTTGNFSGTLDSGCVTFLALTDKGQEMVTYDLLKQALTQGYDVSFTFHPDHCLSTVSPSDEPSVWSGHVSYFRMSKAGDITFTRERQGQLGNRVLEVTVPPTGDAAVTKYVYDTHSRATQWEVNSTCPLGSGLILYK